MSEEEPPIPFPLNPIYNPNDWRSSATFDALDIAYLNSNYLKFPLAQAGTETLNSIIVNGTSSFENTITLNSATANNRQITSSYYNTNDINGIAGRSSRMYQDGINLLISNDATSGKTRFSCEDTGGNPINVMEMESFVGTTCYRPLVILANNNLTMNAGNGTIQQPLVLGDTSNRNFFKLSDFAFNSNSSTGSGTRFDFYDNYAGKGLSIMPAGGSGSFGATTMLNDAVILTRGQNSGAVTISNWNSNMKNGMRVFTTDISNCGLTLQCGQFSTGDWTEFRMSYTRTGGVNTTTTTFNNVINFNPPGGTDLPNAISSARRRLEGLGTLSFTDISGNNTTTGSTTSAIWTDSSLVSGLGRGMFLDCSINGGDIIFRTNNTNGVKSTSLALNGDVNTTYNRLYQELNPSWNNVNGFYELAKDAYPALNPKSSGETAVSTWTARNISQVNNWYSVVWASELSIFCAVSYSLSTSNVVTSPDGITWTTRTTPNTNSLNSVCWSPEIPLFVAVCGGGIGNRVSTSPDGITWTTRTSANDYTWNSVCWSPELTLFVAVASSGTGNRIMTSANGTIGWTARSSPADNGWQEVIWAAELGLFVAVASSGGTASNRVMTSPDGITWTARVAPNTNAWNSLCWSPQLGLLVAVAGSGIGNRVMTSTDGINWTIRTSSIDNNWLSVCWSPELQTFTAVADSGTNTRIMTSFNGINWTTRTSNNVNWASICWSKEQGIFCGVGYDGTNRAMTSSFLGRPPTSQNVFNNNSNSIDELGVWTLTSSTIYSPSLEIRRNTTTPLSRLEIVNDGANSTLLKARCPSGQATMFFNTYNGASDDDVFNITSTRIQVRRPIGFSYLTTPSTATQLGYITGPISTSSGSFTSSASERNFSNFTIVNAGTYSIKVLITLAGGANHTLTECRWCLDGTSATFPSTSTPTKYTPSITGLVGSSLSSTYTSYMNINLDVLATANNVFHINFVLNYSGGSTTTLNAIYSYTRIG